MSTGQLPAGWTRVKFGDVVHNVTERMMPSPAESRLYVGLEHMQSESLLLTGMGSDVDLVGEKLRMRAGDVLFARRNPHLRRVAVAPHDGPFSAHGMVLRTSDVEVLLQVFLPYFLQSEQFMERANQVAVGSLSRTINWKDLKGEEFAIPPIDEQQRIVEILSAVSNNRESLQQHVATARDVRDAVLSAALDSADHSWPIRTFRELALVCTGGVWGSDPGIDEIDAMVYRQTEFDNEGRLSCASGVIRSMTQRQLESRKLQPDDILLQKSAGTPSLPGRVVLVPKGIHRDSTCSNFLQLVRANSEICEPQYLFWVLWYRHRRGLALEFQRGTNIRNLDLNRYLGVSIHLPSLAEQKMVVRSVASVEDLIRKSEEAVTDISDLGAVLRNFLLEGRHVH